MLVLGVITLNGQSFDQDKIALSNFIKRMYNNSPFEGVKIFEDYTHVYLLSVVKLNKANYTSTSAMNRVAQVKSRQQASIFMNGSDISSELIIKSSKTNSGFTVTQISEIIREQSIGFVDNMELLTNFDLENSDDLVFIFIREMEATKKKK